MNPFVTELILLVIITYFYFCPFLFCFPEIVVGLIYPTEPWVGWGEESIFEEKSFLIERKVVYDRIIIF
jgi:hypothetical protein